MPFTIELARSSPSEVAEILRDLPDWFGIEEHTREYIDAAKRLPNYIARDELSGEAVGVLLPEQHFPASAEVHLMAVKRAWHRRGIGRLLLTRVETDLASQGVQLLSLKTLGPSRPDPGYDSTRRFYESAGFIPVEEFLDLWPDNPCLIMAKPLRQA